MQSNPFLRTLLAVMFIAVLASCHSNKQGKFIPKDALMVIVADAKSLASKLPWDEIKKNPQLQQVLSDNSTPGYVKSLLNNPDSSGVDVQSDLIMFMQKDSIGGYMAFEGTVKDANLFKRFVKKLFTGADENTQGGITYLTSYQNCIGWDEEKFIYITDVPGMRYMSAASKRYDPYEDIKSRDVPLTMKQLFALDGSSSLGKNEKFTSLMKESGDIRFWFNGEKFYAGMGSSMAAGPLSVLNLEDVYKNNVTTAVLSFDNGKISINTKSYSNDKIMDFYKKYMSDKLNDDMLKRIPGKDVDVAFAMNLKTEGIKELLTILGAEGLANGQLKQFGLSMDDIAKAFKGDFVFGLTDLSVRMDSATYTLPSGFVYKYPKPITEYNLIFGGSIGDKDAFNKVNNVVQTEVNHGMVYSDTPPPVAIDNNGNFFAVSNKKETNTQFLSGSTSNFDFISLIDGQSTGGYVNVTSLLKGCEGMMDRDSTAREIYDASLKTWKSITFKGGDVNGDAVTSSFEINLVDNSTNSLKQLNQYAASISAAVAKREQRVQAERQRYLDQMNQQNNLIEQPPVSSPSSN